jgi:reactive intermediate/imine deaminase
MSTTHIRFINSPTMAAPRGYTHVAEVTNGRMVFIAGQVALDAQGNAVGIGDFRAQAIQVFENLKAALEAVGADFSQVVKFTFFMVDISQLPILREVRDTYLNTANPPTSSAVEVRRLFRDEFLVEIEAIVVLPIEA